MDYIIRPMLASDRACVMDMMRVFYASPAVYTNGSFEIFSADIDACLSDSPYLEGYVVEVDGCVEGYTMLAKSFSTEFGKPCIWIEDIYLSKTCRGQGIGRAIIDYVEAKYPDAIFRLEVEGDNAPAIYLYEKCGFTPLPYVEMKK